MSESEDKTVDPVTKESMFNHEFDGIRELDNPLPGWWLGTFYITIIFAIFYVFYVHVGSGPTIEQEFKAAVDRVEAKKAEKEAAMKATGGPAIDFAAIIADEATIQKGKTLYLQNCASCHGNVGQGSIGPNLTDPYWIYGTGKVEEIYGIVDKGSIEKGMPPWGPLLGTEKTAAVSVYVTKLLGTDPANPKAPEGKKVD